MVKVTGGSNCRSWTEDQTYCFWSSHNPRYLLIFGGASSCKSQTTLLFDKNYTIQWSMLSLQHWCLDKATDTWIAAAAAAKSLQSCLSLCDPIDGSPPGSLVPGILQARTLEWVAISFSNARKWKVKVKSVSHVQLLATSWTAAYQAPLSMGFSRQEYWSGVPLSSPRRGGKNTQKIYTKKIFVMVWSFT